MRKSLVHSILFLVLCPFFAVGQENSKSFNEHFNSFKYLELEQGLSNLRVTCCLQDQRGFMWFGTRLGLNSYNGLKFRTFFPIPDNSSSLLNSEISVIRESEDGVIWIGTAKGLCAYDYKKETFTRYQHLNNSLGILDLAVEDSTVVWFNTGEALYRYHTPTKVVKRYPIKDRFNPSRIFRTSSGTLFVMSLSGDLFRYHPNKDAFTSIKIFNEHEVSGVSLHFDIAEMPNENLLITSSLSGVKMYNVRTQEVVPLLPKGNSIVPSYIHVALRRHNGDIWFGTENGIYIIKNNDIRSLSDVIHISKSSEAGTSLSDNAIYALYEDIEHGVWIGTFSRGVNYMPATIPDFQIITSFNAMGSENLNVVREIISDAEDCLWVSSEDAGLFTYHPNGMDRVMHHVPLSYEGRTANSIQTLLIDEGKLWIGTFDQGIYIYDLKTARVEKHFHNLPSSRNDIISNAILHLFKSSEGDIMVGTMVGLYCYDREAQLFEVVEGERTGFTNYIYQTRDDTIWVATLNQGLYKLKKKGHTYKAIKQPIAWDDVTTVFEDSKGNFWIGTNTHGLFLYDRKKKRMEQKGINVNSNNIAICKIIEDMNSNLWISTSNGLFWYNLQTEEQIRYGVHNSFPTDQFNFNAGCIGQDGQLYFGTFKGLITFDPNKLQRLRKSFKVCFSDFNADESSFSVSCAVPLYSSPQGLWYRYKVEGVDKDWIIVQGAPTIKYNNLNPGKYQLRVEASTINGLWQDANKEFSILEIQIPFPVLRSPLALSIYTVFLLAVIAAGIRAYWKTNRNKRQQRVEKMRSEMNKELLNDKIKFFTDITHEIRTPLTLIMGSIERMDKSIQQPAEKSGKEPPLQILRENANRLQNLVNQLLDFRKMEASSYAVDMQQVDVKQIVNNLFILFTPVAEQKGIHYEINMCDEDCYVMADPEALTKIVNNMLSNATKYCEKLVELELVVAEGDVVLRVNNDGQHISHEELRTVFKPFQQIYRGGANTTINGTGLGLSLAKKMADLQNASFFYDEDHVLNSFVLSLPRIDKAMDDDGAKREESSRIAMNDEADAFNSEISLLIVDDEAGLRQFVAEELSEKYTIYQADNGKSAMELLERHNISLIITDIMMPVMDGIELCQKVKSDVRYCHIPIVMLTAKVSLNDHVEALNSKSDAYIEKPFHLSELMAQVQNLLENRKLLCSAYMKSPFAMSENVAKNDIDNQFLKSLSDYIYSSIPDRDVTVEMLAAHANMSYRTLFRKIKGLTSLTPNEFIRYIKLKKATELLDGSIPIKRVAEMTGFSSTAYFTACFTKQFGISPGKVIEKNHKHK